MISDLNPSNFSLDSLQTVAEAAHGKLFCINEQKITGFTLDSRTVHPGDCFLAVKGEHTDGHRYIQNAWNAGAALVIASRLPDSMPPSGNLLLVDDVTAALGRIAHAHRMTFSPLTVAVTGSVGKTTTKQFIRSVLSADRPTLATGGNFNNELGLPLTLLSLRPSHRAAVLEMGMSARGEIEYLSLLTCPDIAVITCIGTAHMNTLGSREAIRDAKMEITAGLKPGGTLILNGDEPLLAGQKDAVYVSLSNPASDFRANSIRVKDGMTAFDLHTPNGTLHDLTIPVIGAHNVFDAAIACAVGMIAGIREETLRKGLLSFENAAMRQKIEHIDGVTLVEDCYNACPESMMAALRVLESLQSGEGRRIAVLGDMRELGPESAKMHQAIGRFCMSRNIDVLFTFGEEAERIAQGAAEVRKTNTEIYRNPDLDHPETTADALLKILKKNDTVLFKASRAVMLERVSALVKQGLFAR